MGGVVVRDETGEQIRLPSGAAPDFVRKGWIDLQDLTPAMVADTSKPDVFTKLIAFLQTTWFLLQLIGRAASHLTITTLELFTLAYVCCALGAFGFWLHKPLDVHLPLIIDASPTFTPIRRRTQEEQRAHRAMIKNDRDNIDGIFRSRAGFPVVILCCTLFGGCHILAWNADFPSHVEHILWRVGSVSCIALPLMVMFSMVVEDFKAWLNQMLSRWPRTWLKRWLRKWLAPFGGSIFFYSFVSLYIAVRCYLSFEAFFSLRSVSLDVYTAVPWVQYIPHL
jgi:hypothetical protein